MGKGDEKGGNGEPGEKPLSPPPEKGKKCAGRSSCRAARMRGGGGPQWDAIGKRRAGRAEGGGALNEKRPDCMEAIARKLKNEKERHL